MSVISCLLNTIKDGQRWFKDGSYWRVRFFFSSFAKFGVVESSQVKPGASWSLKTPKEKGTEVENLLELNRSLICHEYV